MEYSSKTLAELKELCKEQNIRGISGKPKAELVKLLAEPRIPTAVPVVPAIPWRRQPVDR